MTKKDQVAKAMRRLIAEGYWKIGQSVGDVMSLERKSEELFGIHVSFGTIRAAEQVLVNEGLLAPIQPGVPTRVIAVPSGSDEDPTLAALRAMHAKLVEAQTMMGEVIARWTQ